jgi:hypothetical protein
MTNRVALLAVAAAAVALGIGAFLAVRVPVRNEITIVNVSGEPLESLSVALPWQSLQFGPLAHGQSTTRAFRIEHDASFQISGKLRNGQRLRTSEGYVTNGQYGETVRVQIEPGGSIRLTQGGGAA